MSNSIKILSVVLLCCAQNFNAHAQWTSQTIALVPGWNAVYLEIQPEPRDCASIFAGLPVESAWGWNRRFTSIQYIQDANNLLAHQPDWLPYFPPSSPMASQSSLYTLNGGRTYLIKATNAATWVINGTATVRAPNWVSDSFNFVGFGIDRTNTPTFQSFFAGAPAHASSPVYCINPSGFWQVVTNPATTAMRLGEAFWIQSIGVSSFSGPLGLGLPQINRMEYGRSLDEQTLEFTNSSLVTRSFVLRQLPSAQPPAVGYPALAGAVPLSYWKFDPGANDAGWREFPNPLVLSNVPPGGSLQLRIAVRRADMVFVPGLTNALYQSLLEITDTIGSCRHLVPVTALGFASDTAAQSPLGLRMQLARRDNAQAQAAKAVVRPGLWIGSASINNVNQASLTNSTPTPTASDFQFRLILHVDSSGNVRLLRKVLQMFWTGHYVLLTDENLSANFPQATLVGRYSSPVFAFANPVLMTNDTVSADALSCSMVLDYDDPLNPFKHSYHPEHDNWDALYATKLPTGVESYTIERDVWLQFTPTDPDGLAVAGYGDDVWGGVYKETIHGLHRHPVIAQGTFRVQLASSVPVLNDGIATSR